MAEVKLNKHLTEGERNRDYQYHPMLDRAMVRPPDRFIYVYSVSKRSFSVEQMPLFPRVNLAGCPQNDRYVEVMRLPDPIPQIAEDVSSGRPRVYDNDGWYAICSLLNPNNGTMDPYFKPDPKHAAYFGTSVGSDLISQGLFPSLNHPPSDDEITGAEKRRDVYYQALISRAYHLEATDRKGLFTLLEENPDVRVAMDQFGLEADWHTTFTRKMACRNCGERIREGAPMHWLPNGRPCVTDWPKAVASGAVTREDVPVEARWWGEEDAKRGPGRPRSSGAEV